MLNFYVSLILIEEKNKFSIMLLGKICLGSVDDGKDHFELRGNAISSVETLA